MFLLSYIFFIIKITHVNVFKNLKSMLLRIARLNYTFKNDVASLCIYEFYYDFIVNLSLLSVSTKPGFLKLNLKNATLFKKK